MVALIVIVCTVAFILLVAGSKTETTMWMVIISVLTSVAAFSVEWQDTIIPLIKLGFLISSQTEDKLMLVNATLTSIPQYILPHSFVMYSMSLLESLKIRTKMIIGVILTIPVFYSFFALPFKPNSWRTPLESTVYFRTLSLWCVPYILVGILIIIYATIKEKNPRLKLQKKLIVVIAFPITITCIVNHFFLRSMGYRHAWRNIVPVLAVMFGVFLIFGVKYGIMGVNLRFDRQRIEDVIRCISSGTEMLNHSLKNQTMKISMSASNIKASSNKLSPDIDDINYNLEVIENSIDHLKNMIDRIQSFTKDFSIEESPNNLMDLVNRACKNCVNHIDSKEIKVIKTCENNILVECDKVHIVETLTNIIGNACEALPHKGEICISIYGIRKIVNISIKDNGQGIKKDVLQHIFEPYFSTKKTKNNFGIGLPYCYIVMNKHKGNIDVISEEGKGTTVILSFPSFRILESSEKILLRSDNV